MNAAKLRPAGYHLLLLFLAAVIGGLEYGGLVPQKGTLLVTLVFWAALVQGAIAVVAVCELTSARWIASLRKELLAARPLLLLVTALFLLWGARLELYPWSDHPGRWLNPAFFLLRNALLLLLSFAAAGRLSRYSLANDRRVNRWAVLYLFIFVASQSLCAFDWVMSLEYPWYSSLFGAYFFIEAIYGAIACSGVIYFLLRRVKEGGAAVGGRPHLNDIGLLTFGFSVLWMGLFFAQYLLLWYGNLPEEVGFIARRTTGQPALLLCLLFLGANFLVPFCVFLSRRAKRSALVVAAVASTVLIGLLAEKALYIFPVVPVHWGLLAAENLLLILAWGWAIHSRERLLPTGGPGGPEGDYSPRVS